MTPKSENPEPRQGAENNPRLVLVADVHGQRVKCYACGETMQLNGAFADINGPPFQAYYHPAHAPRQGAESARN